MKQQEHSIQGVFIFLLLGMFAVMCTLLVLLGAQAYHNMTARADLHNAQRILNAFVRTTVRAADDGGRVYVEDVDGMDVLTIESDIDGEKYYNRIYVSDGYLRQSYISENRTFAPENGDAVCAARGLEAEIGDGLLSATLTGENGETGEVNVALWVIG